MHSFPEHSCIILGAGSVVVSTSLASFKCFFFSFLPRTRKAALEPILIWHSFFLFFFFSLLFPLFAWTSCRDLMPWALQQMRNPPVFLPKALLGLYPKNNAPLNHSSPPPPTHAPPGGGDNPPSATPILLLLFSTSSAPSTDPPSEPSGAIFSSASTLSSPTAASPRS